MSFVQCTVCWHDQCEPAGDSCAEAGAAAWKQASSGGLPPLLILACPLNPHCLLPHSFPFERFAFGWFCLPLGGLVYPLGGVVSLYVVWSPFGWCGLPWVVWLPFGWFALKSWQAYSRWGCQCCSHCCRSVTEQSASQSAQAALHLLMLCSVLRPGL